MQVKAWAWLSLEDGSNKPELVSYGNGAQYQFPIFLTRQEAITWKKDGCGTPGMLYRIAEVTITVKP